MGGSALGHAGVEVGLEPLQVGVALAIVGG